MCNNDDYNVQCTRDFFVQIIMGFAYSILASSLWPLVALVVPQHQIGTAYGM